MTLTTLQLSEPYGHVSFRDVGHGAPVVLIHGVGMQSAAWMPQIRALSETTRVIALDMPGHGGSARLTGAAELPDFVAWLHQVLVALDLGPVSLAGHSMGALIAGGYAAEHPEMVERIALLNGVFRRDAGARQAVENRAAVISQGEFDLETPLNRWFNESESDQAARAKVAGWLAAVDRTGYATAYGAFARGDATYSGRWSHITCPLLALTGSDDPNSTPEMARAMADSARHGVARVIDGHRHMINLTAPDRVNAVLLEWLEYTTQQRSSP